MRSAPAIAFDFRPSRLIAAGGGIMTVLALIGIIASGLGIFPKLALSAFALIYAFFSLRKYLTSQITRIAHGASGWILVDRDGRELIVTLKDHIHRGLLLVLTFSADNAQTMRFAFAPDNIDKETRRRLLLVLAAGEGKTV